MPDYIIEPLDTDSESIYADFVDFVRGHFPDWNPNEAQLDVIIARFFSQQTATVADMSSRVQRAIYRYLGANLENIPPLPGSAATATVSFHVVDSGAHVLPMGSMLGIADANGDMYMFQTLGDMDVPAGAIEWPSITAQALDLGADANNLTGTVEMLEQVDWIDDAQVVGVTSGGSDPEEDEVYIQRLTDNLSIPRRPTYAQDLVVMARNVPGVWRAAAIDNYRHTGGGTYTTDLEDSIAISAVDVNGEAVTGPTLDLLMTYLTENLRQNFLLTWVPPTYHTIGVTYTAHAYQTSGTDGASVKSEVDQSLDNILLPMRYGQIPEQTNDRSWRPVPVMRYLELTTAVENVRQIDYVESLTFSVDGGASTNADKPLGGAFPLTRPGHPYNGTILIP
jgi:hypothetical protein